MPFQYCSWIMLTEGPLATMHPGDGIGVCGWGRAFIHEKTALYVGKRFPARTKPGDLNCHPVILSYEQLVWAWVQKPMWQSYVEYPKHKRITASWSTYILLSAILSHVPVITVCGVLKLWINVSDLVDTSVRSACVYEDEWAFVFLLQILKRSFQPPTDAVRPRKRTALQRTFSDDDDDHVSTV